MPLSVLIIGGTGTISASCARLAASRGMEVTVLNRGQNSRGRPLPESVAAITADITDVREVGLALGQTTFDAVVDFLGFTAADAARSVQLFRDRTAHFIAISSASIYSKPIRQVPLVESYQRKNPFIPYSREKIEMEDYYVKAHSSQGFPVTIVRPSHTYDVAAPPFPGGWTIFDRLSRGDEIVVHGDGTSLWTLTHADDFAAGLVGLLGDERAVGEAFHITSNDVYTWDEMYLLAARVIGVDARLVHIPSELISAAAPDWHWSELFLGDVGHSVIFDTTKIRKYVPSFAPTRTFAREIYGIEEWRRAHPMETTADRETNLLFDRLANGYHDARSGFESIAAGVSSAS